MNSSSTVASPTVVVASLAAAPATRINPWLAVFAVALSASVFCTTEFMPIGLLRYISAGLHVSEGTAGFMVTAPGLLAAVAAPFLTIAVGRHDRRRVLLALGALLVASNLIAMFAMNFTVLIAARVLFGIGLGGFWAIGAGLGGRLVDAPSVGRATSIIFAGVSIGMLVGGAAGALIGDLFGWRAAFGVTAALSLAGLAALFAWLPPLHVEQRIAPRDLLAIVRTRAGRVGLAAMAFALVGQFATYTYVTPFLAQAAGFDGKAISAILFGYTLIGLLGNFIGGAAAPRALKRTLSTTMLFFVVPVLLLPVLGHSQGWALALVGVWGLAYGAMPIALQMWMARAAPDAQEGGMALFVANFQISIALGALFGGVVVDRLGVGGTMIFGAGMATIGLAILLLFATPTAATAVTVAPAKPANAG